MGRNLIRQDLVPRLCLCFFPLLVRVVKTRGRCRVRLRKIEVWRGLPELEIPTTCRRNSVDVGTEESSQRAYGRMALPLVVVNLDAGL